MPEKVPAPSSRSVRRCSRVAEREEVLVPDVTTITTEAELEAVLGEPMEFVRKKVRDRLEDGMRSFIAQSPLVFVSTIDESGRLDVSPKGDPPGFVGVDDGGDLLIPERLGNRLTFGFRNILRTGEIGLL